MSIDPDRETAERVARDAADRRALARVASGEVDAIAELYDRYAPVALGLASKIVRDPEEAQDVVHDAFLAIVERVHQYQPERGSVAGWLVTTVRNLSLDRARRRALREAIATGELAHEPRATAPDPETTATLGDDARALSTALASLPVAQQETLRIAFFEGLSYPEIAERERVPLGTVKSRAARALWALRAALGVDEGAQPRQTPAASDPRANDG